MDALFPDRKEINKEARNKEVQEDMQVLRYLCVSPVL
jgi:hypothetical protein